MTKQILLLSAAFLSTLAAAPGLAQEDVPLIPREALFGNPSHTQGRVSPDGKWLSWIAPRDGVMNIWVAPVSDPKAAKPITAERVRPIRQHFWAPDGRQVLFIQDKAGDENFLLYGVDPTSGTQRALTPFEKTRVQIVGTSTKHKDRILIGVNNRDTKWHDVHLLDLNSGKLTPVMQNDGYAAFIADDDLKLRGAAKARADGGQDLFRIIDGKVEQKAFSTIAFDDVETTSPAGIAADGRTLYWTDSRSRNTAALVEQDLVTGATKVIATDPRVDVGGLLVHPRTRKVQAYTADYLKPEWRPVDRSLAADLTFLKRELGGHPQIGSRSDDDRLWTVSVDPVTGPAPTYLFDRRARTLTKLFVNRPELEGKPLVKMWPVEIKSRDGLTLPSYLTLPASADPDGDGRANAKVPLILSVHGGPNARDFHGFNSTHQWLANRGYAVLSVNYRASTGFGKEFINAGNLQWGRKMHDDLIDAVNWAVAQNVTAPNKVAIMGGSYGGYATLAGLTFTPDTFACGVAAVPPVNLVTLLETIPPYWEAGRQQMYRRLGNLSTAEGRALLKERSPLTYVDRIKKPLLIAQGANDPRVKQAEPDQIVAAMKAKNIPVTYLLFPDEGHGFARPVNNIAYRAVAENFLAECLGGRAEPIGSVLKVSTAQVPHGAEYAPGLKDALALK